MILMFLKKIFGQLRAFFSFVDQTDHLSAFHTLHCVMWYCKIHNVFALTLH